MTLALRVEPVHIAMIERRLNHLGTLVFYFEDLGEIFDLPCTHPLFVHLKKSSIISSPAARDMRFAPPFFAESIPHYQ